MSTPIVERYNDKFGKPEKDTTPTIAFRTFNKGESIPDGFVELGNDSKYAMLEGLQEVALEIGRRIGETCGENGPINLNDNLLLLAENVEKLNDIFYTMKMLFDKPKASD